MKDGQKVTTPAMWWNQRRPEIVVEMYSKYIYGRVPSAVPKVTWTVKTVDNETDRLYAGHRQGSDRRRSTIPHIR